MRNRAVVQSPSSSEGFCVLREVRLPEIVEKRQAEAEIYIFAEQATARGIRMVA